jgi:anthranilate synthase component I
MTDPWDHFLATAPSAEVAGYFEEASGTGGRAFAFTDPDSIVTVNRATTLDDLEHRHRQHLRQYPGGGTVGYLGFDAVGLFEPLLARFPAGSPFPLGELAYVPRIRFRAVPPRSPEGPNRAYRRARPRSDSLTARSYGAGVRHLIEAIRSGDAYQVVLAHRRDFPRPTDLLIRASRLRKAERYAFFFYLKFGDREIVGASPESVIETVQDRAFVNPIAGTLPIAPRAHARLPLKRDVKELAEHRMLVDLARNDLGRTARTGSVHLIFRERRERFAQLEHLVSRVGARLRADVGPWTALAAAFPAGTVSGAPKIRATQLLRREEGTWRGPYGGAAGYAAGGSSRWALAIRTAFAHGTRLSTAAGAGIVTRSEPAREFDETLVKLAQVEACLTGGVA